MDVFRGVSVPATLLFPPGWKARAMEWIIVRIALVMIGFWLGSAS
jgi:hypothetical protein